MSFTSEFEALLNEKKERDAQQAQKAQSMIGLYNAYSQELAAKQAAPATTQRTIGGKSFNVPTSGTLKGHSYDLSNPKGAGGGIEIFQDPESENIVKIILGTAGDAAVDFGKGFMGFSEGLADMAGYGIYGLRRLFGETEKDLAGYKRDIAESTTDQILGGADTFLDQYSVLGNTTDAVIQGVGQFVPMVATGKFLGAKGASPGAVNLATKGMLGASSMGSGMSEAYMSGATDGEALGYGAMSAGAELAFESLFGGMGKAVNAVGFNKGLLGADDLLAKRLAKFVSSPKGKNIVEALVKGGFEGLEEVGTGFAQAVAKKLTYMSEEEFGKILKDENLFEQFLVGALVSDIAQAGDVRIANKTGTDLVTGFTRNEQAVIDKEVENRIAQEQKGGKKLSGKEKSAIYDQVVKDMERGYISTETIESVLGKDALTQYDALSKEAEEFKALYETEGGKLSEKQKDRLAELKEKNKANPYEQLLKSQRDKISKDVSTLAQSDRLGESYAEQTRKGEKFQADVSEYSEAQRKTVQNAIDSGILNNTNRSHEFVDLIAKISADKGISFDFADNAKLKESGFALDGVLVNGFVNENGVTINIQSAKALNRVVGHEITHVLEGTELYDALQSAVTEYAKGKKEYDSRLKELTQLYKGKNANVEQELVADLVGDYLFTDADFIKHLSTEHRNVFQQIYDEIKYLCKVVTAGTKEARQLEKVKKAFADAYRAETKNPTAEGGVKYSIVNLDTGKSYVQASRQVIRGNSIAEWRAQISEFFNRALKNGPIEIETIEGDMLTISKNTAEKARSKTATENGISRELTDKEFLVKLHAEAHIDELAEISHKSKRPPVPDGKKHSFAKDGFTYRTVYFQDFDGSYYRITLSVGENNGISTVYNVGKIKADDIPDGKIISTIGSKADMSSTKFSISSEDENVKQKNDVYLDAVSRGDMQTAQQLVDEAAKAAGYDRRMFHETDAENIHVFDISRGDHGATDYETPYGIFTKTSDKNIGLGSKQMALFVKAQNTLYVNDRADVLNKIPGFIQYYDQIQAIDQKYNALAEQYEDAEFDALQEWMEENPDVDMDTVFPSSYIVEGKPADIDYEPYLEAHRKYMENKKAWEEAYSEVAVRAKTFITEYLRNNKYDSMYFAVDGGSRGRQTDSLIVLDQNQVKSADTVTYDDKGEIIPITRRFDTNKTDIRYSLSKKDFSIAPPVGADVHGQDIGYDIAPPIPESVRRANKARPKIGDPAYAPIAEEYVKQANQDDRMQEKPDALYGPWRMQDPLDIGVEKLYRMMLREQISEEDYVAQLVKADRLYQKRGETVEPALERVREAYSRNSVTDVDSDQMTMPPEAEAKMTRLTRKVLNESKMRNIQKEITNNERLRAESRADYDGEIERLQAEYDGKKNKTTKAANNLLRRLERLRRMRDNVDVDYDNRIKRLHRMIYKVVNEGRMETMREALETAGFDLDELLSKAKRLSIFATVDNTPKRVIEKTFGYEAGQIINDLTVNKVALNESEGIRWLNSRVEAIKNLSKKYGIKPGSKESRAAQIYGEGFWVNEAGEYITYGDMELAADFPDVKKQERIKKLGKDPEVRKMYDETLEAINEVRARNGYPPIPKRDNYFLHFHAMEDTFSKLGTPFNPNDIKAKDLPTDLNGVTADLKPGKPFFASEMQRKGNRTTYDLLGGMERYMNSAKNQIYHVDDIQTFRAFRNYIADMFGQANGLSDIDSLSPEEQEIRIKEVYDGHLSTFAKFLNEEANILAGKTALIDRGVEGVLGRRAIQFLHEVNGQVGKNMVGWNISSAGTNVLPIVQAMAKLPKVDMVRAFAQTVSNKFRNDGFVENDLALIRRRGADRFTKTFWQKISDPGYVLMSAVDNLSSEVIVRAKYNELTRKRGMDSQQAHIRAGEWASRLMGDRSLGQMPQLYNSKTLGLITKFQLEVRNQLDAMGYDTIQEAKAEDMSTAKKAAKITSTMVQLAIFQHLFGQAYEAIAGYNPAFDIVENLIKLFGFDDDEESEDTFGDNLEQAFLGLLEDLPYTGTFTGGRIPIESALPIEEFITGKDSYGNEKDRLETIGEALPYYILPGGYGQYKKTKAGLQMFDEDLPVAGSYTDSGNLRFPVEATVGNVAQAAVFGQYANENARDYFDNGRSPLKTKQIHAFMCTDMSIQDYWAYREGLSAIEADKDADGKTISGSKKEKVIKYIEGLDISDDAKHILLKYEYPGDDTYNYEIIDYLNSRTDISYTEIKAVLEELGFTVDNKGNITWD
jgi:hypothetical protein